MDATMAIALVISGAASGVLIGLALAAGIHWRFDRKERPEPPAIDTSSILPPAVRAKMVEETAEYLRGPSRFEQRVRANLDRHARGEMVKQAEDAVNLGIGFARDGVRIAPADVFHTPEPDDDRDLVRHQAMKHLTKLAAGKLGPAA